MNYAALIASLIALGVSVSVILAQPGVTESKDGFCHRIVELNNKETCIEGTATVADDGTTTANICITPYVPNKCP